MTADPEVFADAIWRACPATTSPGVQAAALIAAAVSLGLDWKFDWNSNEKSLLGAACEVVATTSAACPTLEQMCWRDPQGGWSRHNLRKKIPLNACVIRLVRRRIRCSRFRSRLSPSAFSSPTGFLLSSLWLSEENLASSQRLLDRSSVLCKVTAFSAQPCRD